MTPLAHVTQAAEHFANGKRMYKFDVPDDRVTRSYIARVRSHIKRLGYRWRVSHNAGQGWVIMAKTVVK